jgi:hypothetical protein
VQNMVCVPARVLQPPKTSTSPHPRPDRGCEGQRTMPPTAWTASPPAKSMAPLPSSGACEKGDSQPHCDHSQCATTCAAAPGVTGGDGWKGGSPRRARRTRGPRPSARAGARARAPWHASARSKPAADPRPRHTPCRGRRVAAAAGAPRRPDPPGTPAGAGAPGGGPARRAVRARRRQRAAPAAGGGRGSPSALGRRGLAALGAPGARHPGCTHTHTACPPGRAYKATAELRSQIRPRNPATEGGWNPETHQAAHDACVCEVAPKRHALRHGARNDGRRRRRERPCGAAGEAGSAPWARAPARPAGRAREMGAPRRALPAGARRTAMERVRLRARPRGPPARPRARGPSRQARTQTRRGGAAGRGAARGPHSGRRRAEGRSRPSSWP